MCIKKVESECCFVSGTFHVAMSGSDPTMSMCMWNIWKCVIIVAFGSGLNIRSVGCQKKLNESKLCLFLLVLSKYNVVAKTVRFIVERDTFHDVVGGDSKPKINRTGYWQLRHLPGYTITWYVYVPNTYGVTAMCSYSNMSLKVLKRDVCMVSC